MIVVPSRKAVLMSPPFARALSLPCGMGQTFLLIVVAIATPCLCLFVPGRSERSYALFTYFLLIPSHLSFFWGFFLYHFLQLWSNTDVCLLSLCSPSVSLCFFNSFFPNCFSWGGRKGQNIFSFSVTSQPRRLTPTLLNRPKTLTWSLSDEKLGTRLLQGGCKQAISVAQRSFGNSECVYSSTTKNRLQSSMTNQNPWLRDNMQLFFLSPIQELKRNLFCTEPFKRQLCTTRSLLCTADIIKT